MKKRNLLLVAALAAAGVVGVTTVALAPTAVMAAEGQKVSAKVGKPLRTAQEAMNAKNWDAAWTAIQEAQAVEPKTPYDAYMVDELGWYVLLQKKDYAGAATMLERAIGSGFVQPADQPQRLKALAQLNYQVQNYPKAIEFGNRFLESSPGDRDIGVLVAQSYYLQKDYAGARGAAQKLTTGPGTPSEQLLLINLRSNFELNDRPGTVQALEQLVRYYPQPKYWEDLLSNQLYETKDDRHLRALYRLIDQTNTLDKADEYSEMASTLIAGGFPSEAEAVLQRGLSASLFSGDAKTRAQSDLERAKAGAASDRKDLPGAEKAMATAKTGNEMVANGKLFFSVGDYAKAIDAIQRGLAKGGVTDMDDANALLGVARVRTDKLEEARPAFAAIKDAKYARIGQLWQLYLDTKTAPPAAAPEAAPTTPPSG
jgi:outer membrane protein assembly factor BamD (BamD/ComL family)